jgi:hypothetical protein
MRAKCLVQMKASISWLASRNEFSTGIARAREPARCRLCRGISGPKHNIAKTTPRKVEWIPDRSTNYSSGKPGGGFGSSWKCFTTFDLQHLAPRLGQIAGRGRRKDDQSCRASSAVTPQLALWGFPSTGAAAFLCVGVLPGRAFARFQPG